jgi:hypothetical protein
MVRALDHLGAIVGHASGDFFDIGRHFLVGVLLSSFVQVIVPGLALYAIGRRPLLSVFVMITAAFLLSVTTLRHMEQPDFAFVYPAF